MDKIKIQIKPLSVNEAYKGKKYRTDKCSKFKRDLFFMLPDKMNLPAPPYVIYFNFGLSSASSDGDNCIKIAQDVISDKYNFNDKLIRKWVVEAIDIKKGQEFIEFKIESLI